MLRTRLSTRLPQWRRAPTVGEHSFKHSPTTAASRPSSRCGRVPPGAGSLPLAEGVFSHLGHGRRVAYPVVGPVPRQVDLDDELLFCGFEILDYVYRVAYGLSFFFGGYA